VQWFFYPGEGRVRATRVESHGCQARAVNVRSPGWEVGPGKILHFVLFRSRDMFRLVYHLGRNGNKKTIG
jgi:hypothetical protein